MTVCEALETEASDMGIEVLTEQIPVPYMTAVYIRLPSGSPKIIIEPHTMAERTCDLAEELGHHNTGTDSIIRYDNIKDWQAEARARKWAHDRLLSVDAIMTASKNAADIYDLADVLGVTVQFLREAVDDYMARGLWAMEY